MIGNKGITLTLSPSTLHRIDRLVERGICRTRENVMHSAINAYLEQFSTVVQQEIPKDLTDPRAVDYAHKKEMLGFLAKWEVMKWEERLRRLQST